LVDDLRSEVENRQGVLQDETLSDGALGSIETMKSVQSPDIVEVVLWSDCPDSAPFIITNHILEGKPGKKYMYMWDDKETPDEPWRFLTPGKFVDSWTYDYLWVEEIGADDALSMLQDAFVKSGKKNIMFHVHGWNTEVADAWCNSKSFKEDSEYFSIPIIWRTDRNTAYQYDYRYDRVRTAPNAGITLSKIFNSFFAKIHQPKTWMCHSMGCYVTQFFATEVSEAGDFDETNRFDNVFLVAPDLRYDIFNEWPRGSGKDKNECRDDEWNNPDDAWRIPDCRSGGGDALVDMSNNPLQVHWNPDDYSGLYREGRLSLDLGHTWPLSVKSLLNYGDGDKNDRKPKDKYKDTVKFTKHTDLGDEHSYDMEKTMMDIYNAYAL